MAAPMKLYCARFPCRYQILFLRQVTTQMKQCCYATAADTKSKVIKPGMSKSTNVQLEPWVSEALANNTVKAKQHPGRLVLPTVTLPQRLQDAASVLLEKYPVKELSRRADKLANYLWSRHPPTTDIQVSRLASNVHEQLVQKRESEGKTKPVEKAEVLKVVRQKVYHWQPVTYDAYKSLLYLTAHLAHNYSVLLQCFTELAERDPDFVPRSVYNFGSGLGTSVWAANSVWGSRVYEQYCVDQSQDMNTVARLLLQDGDSQRQMSIPGVVFRQFAPSPTTNQFDMVVSAYTLLDQPDKKKRYEVVDSLWRMTADVLVLVENGTSAGFSLINEARERILEVSGSRTDENLSGYIFAPCPHDGECPKFTEKQQPCFSHVSYKPLSQNHTRSTKCSARYAYIVVRKGRRKEGEPWPRVIQDTIQATRHTHCHLCCPDGTVRHMIFTASKQGQDMYKCSRYTKWGDLFPVRFLPEEEE